MEYLNLTRAARLLASLTGDPSATDDVHAIIRAGAAGKTPVYWFNDLHRATYIADFTDSKQRNLRATHSDGPQQMTRTSLRELAISESVAVFDFELTDQDFALLEKIKGKAVDDDGNLLGYRHPDTTDGTVTITRDQLFVYAHDLKAYAATLAPDAVVDAPVQTPLPATVKKAKNKKLPWWQVEYSIHEMAQNIGSKFHEENQKKTEPEPNAASVHRISEEIEIRINQAERRSGRGRQSPKSDTIRGALTGWKFRPK